MTDERLKQYKEKINDKIKQAKKQKALERAILKFVPKKKRGFLQIGASCIVAELTKKYLPYRRATIVGYEITKLYGLVIICMPSNGAFTFKIQVEHVYHSVMDFAEKNYDNICSQITFIQHNFANGTWKFKRNEEEATTVRKLVNIKRKVDAKRRKKFPPPAVDCRTLFEQK